MQRRIDRRGSLRFEIVGTLRGTAVADQYVRIRNIGMGGALVESAAPLPVEARVSFTLTCGALENQLDARVLHVTSLISTGYLIGLEFVTCDATLLERIDGLLSTTA